MHLHTYLNYGGNCEEAFKFYEKHLGGKITMLMRHGEQPGGQTPPGQGSNWPQMLPLLAFLPRHAGSLSSGVSVCCWRNLRQAAR